LFVSPTTSPRRAKKLVSAAGGFIYYVSLTGVTGTRKKLPSGLLNDLRRIKAISKKPLCVGFGVSTSAQVVQILRVADGVIVGSAIVRKIKEYRHDPQMARKVAGFVSRMKHV
jgi:tryptophan synthase alpha chain